MHRDYDGLSSHMKVSLFFSLGEGALALNGLMTEMKRVTRRWVE